MSYLSFTLVLFFLLTVDAAGGGTGDGEGKASDEFLNKCPKSTCGDVEIRFPFRLNSSDSQCGLAGLALSCTSGEPFLTLRHDRRPFKVTSIDYKSGEISIDVSGFWPQCPMRNMSAIKLSDGQYFYLFGSTDVSFISCSKEFTPDAKNDRIAGPISCLASRGDEFVYVVDQSESMDKLPLDCMVISTDGEIGGADQYSKPFNSFVDSFFSSSEVRMVWSNRNRFCNNLESGNKSDCEMSTFCCNCENQDKECRLDLRRRASLCIDVGHKHISEHPVNFLHERRLLECFN